MSFERRGDGNEEYTGRFISMESSSMSSQYGNPIYAAIRDQVIQVLETASIFCTPACMSFGSSFGIGAENCD